MTRRLLAHSYPEIVDRARVKAPSRLTGAAAQPGRPRLWVHVVFTDPDGARAALSAAVDLARELDAHIVLLAPKVVPYPLPLEEPPVSSETTDERIAELVRGQEAEILVKVLLCRDAEIAIREALGPQSLVVIGGRSGWSLRRDPALARILRRDGHEVVAAKRNI